VNKLKQLHQYLHYYFSAKTRFGIHSPFVFDFICNVVNKKTSFDKISGIESIRSELRKNNSIIEVTDLGAANDTGSRTRMISRVAKTSLKNRKYASLLYRIVNYYKPGKVLELGTSLGISSCYMAKANPDSHIITIEGCPNISGIAKANAGKAGLNNIEFISGNFDEIMESVVQQHRPEIIFFDGNHTEDATLKYFETCVPYTSNESIFIFDDINWSEGMMHAWEKIKNHKASNVSIDLYFLGIVFFRKELSKENFVIRF
jgi:predicted O-methyltransferase YrrM